MMGYIDLEKKRAYQREWQLGPGGKAIKARYRARLKDLVMSLKTACIDCGETDKRCLDFHHRDPDTKDRNVSATWLTWGKERILAEIAKCDVICANCHRKRTFDAVW